MLRYEVRELFGETGYESTGLFRVWDLQKEEPVYCLNGKVYQASSVSGAYFVADTLNGVKS